MGSERNRVLVVGGGITGLSAAFYVQKYFQEKDLPVEITLVEKSPRLGGKINTLHRDGFVIERGPDSFLARKMPVIDITRDLGLEDQLVPTNPKGKKNYILHKGKLHLMPQGLMLGIPTEFTPFMKTGLVSLAGKARAALDLVLPRRKETGDESLGDFLERRLGREVQENIAAPLLSGIYAGDTHNLSLQATFPQFHAVEKKYGSIMKGMMASKLEAAKSGSQASSMPAVAKNSMFLSYKRGLTTLVEALQKALANENIITNMGIKRLQKQGDAYIASLENDQTLTVDSVILALPAFITAKLLGHYPKVKRLGDIPYVSVANVVLAFDRKEIKHDLQGSGFVVPHKENRNITACTWTSSKWLHTAPEGKVLLRCYLGHAGEEGVVRLSDHALVQKVREDLQDLMGITAEPLFYEVTKLENSMPQYPVGHLDVIQEARHELSENLPGVYVTGSGCNGVGIPDCVRQGREAASQVLSFLGNDSK